MTIEQGLYDRIVLEADRVGLNELATRRLVAELRHVDPAELADRMAELVAEWARSHVAGAGERHREQAAIELVAGIARLIELGADTDSGAETDAGVDGIVDRLLDGVDPWVSDLGRLRSHESLPKRVHHRDS